MTISLPSILAKAREVNTNKKYECYFNKWSKWCEQFNEVNSLPANEDHVALFLASLIQDEKPITTIEAHFYSIEYFHKLALYENPCESKLCGRLMEAARRTCKNKSERKEPIEINHLLKVYELIGKERSSLLDLRTFASMLLSFVGFLRYSEVSQLRECDLDIHETHMKVFIRKCKTDVYRKGNWIYIAKLDSEICPIKIINQYVKQAQANRNSEKFLFRGVSFLKSKNEYKLRNSNKPLSYSAARTHMLTLLDRIGLNTANFSLQSLRSGGATAAANNGTKDRLFKRHGRWRSETAKDGYVKDNISELLSVTKNLGL